MSDMKKLLEDISKFSFADPKGPAVVKTNKPIGSRVADIGPGGKEYNVKTDKAWDDAHKDDDEEDLAESLMREYKYFVKEAPVVATAAPTTSSPVAAINPAGGGNPAVASTTPPATNTATSQTGTAPAPGTAAAGAQAQAAKPPVAGQAPKPGAPVAGQPTPPANQAQPAGQAPKPGAPAAGTATPPNPQQVKQQTDAVTKMLNNPAHPMNAQLQALIKKAGSVPS